MKGRHTQRESRHCSTRNTALFFLLKWTLLGEIVPSKAVAIDLLLLFLLWNCGIRCFTVSRWLTSPKVALITIQVSGSTWVSSQLKPRGLAGPGQPLIPTPCPRGKWFSLYFSWCCFLVSLCNFSSLAEQVFLNVRRLGSFNSCVPVPPYHHGESYFPVCAPASYWPSLSREQKEVMPSSLDIYTSQIPGCLQVVSSIGSRRSICAILFLWQHIPICFIVSNFHLFRYLVKLLCARC